MPSSGFERRVIPTLLCRATRSKMVAVDVTRIHQVLRKLEITRTEKRRIVWNEIFTRNSRFFDRGKGDRRKFVVLKKKRRKFNFLIKRKKKNLKFLRVEKLRFQENSKVSRSIEIYFHFFLRSRSSKRRKSKILCEEVILDTLDKICWMERGLLPKVARSIEIYFFFVREVRKDENRKFSAKK